MRSQPVRQRAGFTPLEMPEMQEGLEKVAKQLKALCALGPNALKLSVQADEAAFASA